MSHPAGHSHGQIGATASAACRTLPDSWRDCPEYLFGVDLFNRAYLWEAHEAWEIVWMATGPTALTGRFLQSLIQVTASLLRSHLGTPAGAQRLLAKAGEKLDAVEEWIASRRQSSYMGVELRPWRRAVELYLDESERPYPFLELRDR